MQLFEDLFAAVMTATDPTDNNRPLHIMFQLKPSKKVCSVLLKLQYQSKIYHLFKDNLIQSVYI